MQEEFLTICEDFLTFLKNPYPNFLSFVIIHSGKLLITAAAG